MNSEKGSREIIEGAFKFTPIGLVGVMIRVDPFFFQDIHGDEFQSAVVHLGVEPDGEIHVVRDRHDPRIAQGGEPVVRDPGEHVLRLEANSCFQVPVIFVGASLATVLDERRLARPFLQQVSRDLLEDVDEFAQPPMIPPTRI